MILFWILVAGLLALVGWLVLPTLLGHTAADDIEREDVNRALQRKEFAELQAARAADEIDDDAYRQARDELRRRILESSPETDRQPASGQPWLGRVTAFALMIAIPVMAVFGYHMLGGGDAAIVPESVAATAIPPAHAGAGMTSNAAPPLDDLTERLAQRLQDHPEDADGWLLLARSYEHLGRAEAARAAYAQALALLPEDADLLADYADNLAAAQGRRLDGEPTVLVDRALRHAPDHPKALWLAATAALQRGDDAQAAAHWQHLRRLLPEGSPDRRVIDRNLAALGEQSTGPLATADDDTAPALVRGRVDISPEMRTRVADDDTVFIFARAADGPPMPLAVLRKQVRDLPFEFSLDDSLAMQPQLKLSRFDQVVLGARVSRNGTVTQRPGEPRGDLGPVPTRGGAEQRLWIDQAGS